MTRHAFSFLSNGPQGWIQQTVFVATGLLNITAGIGLGRVLPVGCVASSQSQRSCSVPARSSRVPGRRRRRSDIQVGAPVGYPDAMTFASAMHAVGFTASMLSWVVLLAGLALWFRRQRQGGWALAITAVALAVLIVPALSGLPFGTVYLYVAVSIGFIATSIALWRIATDRTVAR